MKRMMAFSMVVLFTGIFFVTLLLVEISSTGIFTCGAGLCNLPGKGDQFCSTGPESRCVFCRDVEKTCFKKAMPYNCTNYCLMSLAEKPCKKLANIVNGFHNESGVSKPGKVVQSKCHTGYHMIGSEAIRCLSFGQWSDTLPTCTETCEVPAFKYGTIVDGITYKVYKPGMSVTYFCDDGYSPIAPEATCLFGGKWSSLECVKHHHTDWQTILLYVCAGVICFQSMCVIALLYRLYGEMLKRCIQCKINAILGTKSKSYEADLKTTERPLIPKGNSPSSQSNHIDDAILATEGEKETNPKLLARYFPPECDDEQIKSTDNNQGHRVDQAEEKNHPDREHNGTDDKILQSGKPDSRNQNMVLPGNISLNITNINNGKESLNITYINNGHETHSTVQNGLDKKNNERAEKKDKYNFNCKYSRLSTEETRYHDGIDDKTTDEKKKDADNNFDSHYKNNGCTAYL